MKRGSTPTHSFELPENIAVMTDYVEVTYGQDGCPVLSKIVKAADIEGHEFEVELTQEDTFKFRKGSGIIELRVLTLGGEVIPSEPIRFTVEDSLSEEVLK